MTIAPITDGEGVTSATGKINAAIDAINSGGSAVVAVPITTSSTPTNINPLLGRLFAITPSGDAGDEFVDVLAFPLTVDDTYAPEYIGQRITLYIASDPGDTVVRIREEENDGLKCFPLIPFQEGTSQRCISLTYLGAAVTLIWVYEAWFIDYGVTHLNFDDISVAGQYSLEFRARNALPASNAAGGDVQWVSGAGDGAGHGGVLAFAAGSGGTTGIGGHVTFDGGTGQGGEDGGNVEFSGGAASGGGNRGLILLRNLPTSDPLVADAPWNDGGTLKISVGP